MAHAVSMLWSSKGAEIEAVIREGRGIHDEATWEAVKGEAERWRPPNYSATQQALRDQYDGRIQADLVRHVSGRWPHTGPVMQAIPLNWVRLYAENAASVHDWPASYYLERDGKEGKTTLTADSKPPEDAERAKAFERMITEAELGTVMAEAERRVKVAKSIFLRVHSDSVEAVATGSPPRTRVSIFWPSDVLVIPHPACPTSLDTCVALMARISGEHGASGLGTSWEVWTRSFEDGPDGLPQKFGSWRLQHITETVVERAVMFGRSQARKEVSWRDVGWKLRDGSVSETYPLARLPWVAWHDGIPDGLPYLDGNQNLVELCRAVNSSMMAEQFAVEMNSATPVVRKTDSVQAKEIVLGPGVMPNIPRGDDIVPVPLSADFAGIRAATKALLGSVALTNRLRVDGFDVERGADVSSGVALKIKGEPQTKQRLESVARAIVVEEKLLAIMIAVTDQFRGTTIAAEGVTARMRPTDPPEYEDREVTTRRWIMLKDAGAADLAEVRLNAGASRTIDEAKARVTEIADEKAARVAANPRLTALMQAGARPEPGEPEDADGSERKTPDRGTDGDV